MQTGRRFIDLEPAGFARRLLAFLVDLIIVYVAVVVLLQLVLDPLREALGPGWVRVGWFYIGYTLLTVSLPTWLYFAGYESSDEQATLGKRWLGVVVTGPDGGEASFWRALLRTLLKLLPFEVAHMAIALPANPFVDPLTDSFSVPALEDLGGTVIAGILLALLMIGGLLLTMALHPDRRGPHDLLAGTYVMKDPEPVTRTDPATAPEPLPDKGGVSG
jgi:uncharacterized RDD family membrane protein YckC